MTPYDALGLADFCRTYRRMRVQPVTDTDLYLEGFFDFAARSEEHGQITDSYHLRITVPARFPQDLPVVHELGERIPRRGRFHINPGDSSLCLGSRLRVLFVLSKKPTLLGFAETCLVPYLFAVSRKLLHGGDFVFGELGHGSPGELADYVGLFALKTVEQAKRTILYLGIKKRRANKLPCPCGCGKRLGKCSFNRRLKKFRKIAERSWFRKVSSDFSGESRSGFQREKAARSALPATGRIEVFEKKKVSGTVSV